MQCKKIRTVVYLDAEQAHLLRLLNERTQVAQSEYIRRGVDFVLDQHKNILPGQMLLIQDEPFLEENNAEQRDAAKASVA